MVNDYVTKRVSGGWTWSEDYAFMTCSNRPALLAAFATDNQVVPGPRSLLNRAAYFCLGLLVELPRSGWACLWPASRSARR
jgi:hypothetical protein